MILPHILYLGKNPTQFPEKILRSLFEQDKIIDDHVDKYIKEFYCRFPDYPSFTNSECFSPKHHTIREDKTDRWHRGCKIHFTVCNRSKRQFQFAPVVRVVSTQRIFMTYSHILEITIGSKYQYIPDKEKLAINDGFESLEAFENYFIPLIEKSENQFFSGKIIHWTDLRYNAN